MYAFDAAVNNAAVVTVPRLPGFRIDVTGRFSFGKQDVELSTLDFLNPIGLTIDIRKLYCIPRSQN